MNGLNDFQRTLDALGSIVGHDIIRGHGLSIILCLASATEAGAQMDLMTLAERTALNPVSLGRYVAVLDQAGIVQLPLSGPNASLENQIRITDEVFAQISELFASN
ncbi:MAG: hypothetical protein WBO17_08675 [Sphingorhabdus sp.]